MGIRLKLLNWIKEKHGHQKIKKTTEPYLAHLVRVGELADQFTNLGYEIGLTHDLLEDTQTDLEELFNTLLSFDYSSEEANEIKNCTQELTDSFTKKAYPLLSKKARKKLEHKRLIHISSKAQTVKYADLADNVNWMRVHDQKNLRKYLIKKKHLLTNLNNGDAQLHFEVVNLIKKFLLDSKNDFP